MYIQKLWLTPQNIVKEHLPGIIKEKEYHDIKIHAFQWKSIKNDRHKFISIINVKLASWMRNVNGHDVARVALTSKFR